MIDTLETNGISKKKKNTTELPENHIYQTLTTDPNLTQTSDDDSWTQYCITKYPDSTVPQSSIIQLTLWGLLISRHTTVQVYLIYQSV